MQILPAIDIKDGQAVRLFKGDFNQKTVVNPDIIEQAKTFKNAGIQFIHLVDLDGTLDGRATNRDLITEVKKISGLGIEVGGGIRTLEQIRDYLAVGIDRIIIGSMAVKDPDFVRAALEEFGADKIVVGIDAKAGLVATEGWLETSNVDYITLVSELTTAKVIASGGIAELSDLNHLQEIGVAGTIVGKAYYNGNITLDQLKSFGG